ncbi:MAG: metallophosphoesterase family protein, partial [Brevinematia bacterium]
AEKSFYNFIAEVSGDLKIPIIAINGNHDSIDKIESINTIAKKVGRVKLITAGSKSFEKLLEDKENLITSFNEIDFLAFPFIPRYKYSGEYQKIFETFIEKMLGNCGENVVLISHDELEGATYSSTETVNNNKTLSITSIYKTQGFQKVVYWALGHIHKYQEISKNRIYYSGSILEIDFGETGEEKGVITVEIGTYNNKIQFNKLPKQFEFKQIYINKIEEIDKVIDEESGKENKFIKLKISDKLNLPSSIIEELKRKIKNIIVQYSNTNMRDSKVDIRKFNESISDPIEIFKEYCKINNKTLNKLEEDKLKEIYEEVKILQNEQKATL